MQPKKYDSFQPKRATNIDGFFVKPAQNRPRKPVFREQPSAKSQSSPAMLADMPRRTSPQPVLSSASAAGRMPPRAVEFPVNEGRDGHGAEHGDKQGRERRRDRKARLAGGVTPQSEKKSRSWRKIFKRSGLVVGALVLAFGLWFGFRFYKDIAKITGNKNPLSLLSAFQTAHLKNQDGRVNILVAGNSADDTGHDGGSLTDSIMVLSVNTRDNTALMLSVPRDLWVSLPGGGHSKINAAYPDGGMDELQTVIESNLGLTIDYQALVNYTAFKDLVNAVGGITITIKSSDPRGIYDPSVDYTTRNCCALAKYPNGQVTLNGKQALNLARARGDSYGSYGYPMADFDRTQHQRDMLIAIKDKASSANVIANPLKVGNLVDAVGNNVTTNLQLKEIQTLYTYMKKVDDTKIASYNINTLKGGNTTMLANYTSSDGQSALIPAAGLDDFSDIQTQITRLLSADPVAQEGSNVVMLNGTDTVGLAKAQEATLTAKGITVSSEADAPANQAATTIIDNTAGKNAATLSYLKSHYGATVTTSTTLSAAYPDADFIVILGQTAAAKQTQ